MPLLPELFIPSGGMNQDDSYINPSPDGDGNSAFQAGDFRYALNLRTGSTRGDSLGDAENIKSSLIISAYKVWNGSAWVNGSQPSGTNTPRGKKEDSQLRSTFYVYYNSSGNHTLCQYKSKERTVYELLKWNGLNIQETAYVSMARVGNFLILTDNYNKPRIVDYTTIHSLKATLGNSFTEYHISFSKWAPVAPIQAIYFEAYISPTVNKKIEKTIAQFSYRYWYVGGFYSAWGPVSNTFSNLYLNGPIAAMILRIPGLVYNSVTPDVPNNHNEASFYRVVQFIEIAYRANQLDTWKSYKKWPVIQSGSGAMQPLSNPLTGLDNALFEFDGRAVGTPIAPEVFKNDFDDVPLLSGCTEVIDNRAMFGNNLEEHTFVESTDFIENVTVYNTHSAAWFFYGSGFFSGITLNSDAELLLIGKNKLSQQTFKSRGVYKFGLEFKDETGKKSLIYTTDAWIVTIPDNKPITAYTEDYYAVGWNFKSTFFPPDWATSYQILRTNCLNISYFLYGYVNRFTLLKDDVTVVSDQVTTSETTQQVIRESFDLGKGDYSLAVRLGAQTRKTRTTTTLGDASRIYIDINNWANAGAQDSPRTKDFPLNKLYYEYQEGDRVRFFGSSLSATPTIDEKIIYDVPILEFTGRALIIEKPIGILWLPTTADTEDNYVIEVYRPVNEIKKEDLVYNEMGEWYPITNPKAPARDFLKRDWRWTDETTVTAAQYKDHYGYIKLPCYAGDCHMIVRNYYYDYFGAGLAGDVLEAHTPSMNPDKDFVYGRWEKNNGRPNTAYENKPLVEHKTTQIKFGGKYLQDAVFNNLNSFRALDQYLYPQEYGDITEMKNTTSYQVESVGSILLVLGSVKTISVYVNRTTLEDLGGRTQFFLSDKVLGAYNSSLGNNGCINPESIGTSDNGNVYWWDQFNGCWVRYGRDGNTDISSTYKMGNWFKELADLIDPYYDTATPPRVLCEFDQFHKELITYFSHPSLPESFRGYSDYKGMVFNEKSNKWKFAHNYDADIFMRVNNNVLGIKNGQLYLLEAGNDYGTLLGTKYPSKMEAVFNKTPHANKTWQTITEISSHKWGIERTLSEYFGSRDYQQSSLLVGNLTEEEFTFVADLLNDVNTPTFTDPELATATGDKLRSKVLRVLLRLDDSVNVRSLLHQVILGYIDSPKNV